MLQLPHMSFLRNKKLFCSFLLCAHFWCFLLFVCRFWFVNKPKCSGPKSKCQAIYFSRAALQQLSVRAKFVLTTFILIIIYVNNFPRKDAFQYHLNFLSKIILLSILIILILSGLEPKPSLLMFAKAYLNV
jgi:hypothetical protein